MRKSWKRAVRALKFSAAIFFSAAVLAASISLAANAAGVSATTTDFLNLRQGAGTNTRVLETLGDNVTVTVLDNSDSQWAKVQTAGGKVGYCFKQYLRFSGETAPSPSASTGSATVTTGLNLRAGPSLSSGILRVLSAGTQLKILDNSDSEWAKVQTPSGQQGWCCKTYLKFSAPQNAAQTGSQNTGSASPASGAAATTTDYLNLREGAGLGYRVLLTMAKGLKVSVLDNSNASWVKVLTPGGKQGWCSREYLNVTGGASSPASPPASSGNDSQGSAALTGASVTADLLRLREKANISSQILSSLPYGTYLKALAGVQNGWIRVQAPDGKTGYVCAEYIKLLYGSDMGSAQNSGSLAISAASRTVPQGKTLWLTCPGAASWASSNPAVATVSNGYVYAVAPGTAQITASSGSNTASCAVSVTEAEAVRAAFASPNIAAPGERITFTAVTDASRDGVEFTVVLPDGGTQTLEASAARSDTTGGVTTRVWTACASFRSAGVYDFTARASADGSFRSGGVSSSTWVSTQGSETAATSEKRRASDKMISLIAQWEGYVPEVYADQLASSHVPTIGYGCTLSANDIFYNNISQTEAWALLIDKVNNSSYTSELNKMIENRRYRMNQNQADCLISFAFNVGAGYFNSSRETDFRRIMDNAVVPPDIPGSGLAATVTYDASMRAAPALSSDPVCRISSGTAATVIDQDFSEQKDGWYRLRLSNGLTGWMNSGYVRLANADSLVHDLNYTNAYAFGTELILWNQANGKFYSGLFYRRLGEANVYNYGDYEGVRYNRYGYTYPPSASSLN